MGLSLLAFDAQFFQGMQIRLGWENTDQLAQWDRMLVAYFAGGSLDPTLQSLFSDRELVHLTDIRGLLGLLVRITEGLTAIYLLLVVLLFLLASREALRLFAATVWVSAVLLLVAGGLIVLFFDQFFLQFHLLSFSNDFWQLGPQYLLYRLFPPDLFFQAALPYLALVFLLMLRGLFAGQNDFAKEASHVRRCWRTSSFEPYRIRLTAGFPSTMAETKRFSCARQTIGFPQCKAWQIS